MSEIPEKPQKFKDTPLGPLPLEWCVERFVDEIALRHGYQFRDYDFVSSGFPVVKIGAVSPLGFLDLTSTTFINKNRGDEFADVELFEGDILMSLTGNIGRCVKVPKLLDQRIFQNYRVGKFSPITPEKWDHEYLFYLLSNFIVFNQINQKANLTAQANIGKEEFEKIYIPRPSLEEQKKIGEILGIIDSTIAHTSALIAKLKQMKAGLLHDLLTRGLDENGELRDAIAHPEQFKPSPLGLIPNDWKACELSDLVDPTRPVCYGILMPGYGYPDGIPVIKVKDIVNGEVATNDLLLTSPEIDNQYHRSRLYSGDLLFTIRGTVGRMAFVPESLKGANITQDTARLAITGAEPRYVRQYLETPIPKAFIELHTIGQAVKGINLRDVRRIPITLPSRTERLQIIELCDVYELHIRLEEAYLNKLKEQKKGLMHDLLTGRVRVTDLQKIPA